MMHKLSSKKTLVGGRIENVEIYNLYRREPTDAGFSVIGAPRLYAAEGVVPVGVDTSGVIVDDGTSVGVLDTERAMTCVIERVNAVVRCVLPMRDSLIVMAADGAHVMPRDENGQPVDSGGVMLMDGVSLTAEEAEYLTMTTDAVVLSREYNIGAMGESADRTALQRQVEAAYERVGAEAARAGVFIAPVIARATLRDVAGAVVWRGPEVLLTVPGANVFDRTIEIEMQDNRTVGASTRDVPSYCIRVRVDAGKVQAWNERVSRLEIEVSPQFHPWSASSTCHGTVTVARRQSGGTNVLVAMPSLELGLSANWPARSAYLVKTMTSLFDKVARVTGTILNPLERGVDTVVGCNGWPELREESGALVSALSNGKALLSPSEVELRRVLAPHGFSARCVAAGGQAVAWGNISIDRYCGYTAMDMAVETRPGVGWTSSTKVSFGDGSTAVHNAMGTDNAPERLSSLITYPDSTVRCIDVTVEYDVEGELPRHWHINLEPDASGTQAIAFETSLKGHTGIDDASAWINEPRSRRAMPVHNPGLCIAAHPDRPLEPLALLDTDTVIRNVAVARGGGGAWNYGRARFYVFCSDKVEMVTAERGLTSLAAVRIAETGIKDGSGVTMCSDGSMVFADERMLYLITPTGRLKTFCRLDRAVDRLGYDRRRNEIIAADSDGARVYHVGNDGKVLSRSTSPAPSGEWLTVGDHVLVSTQSGLFGLAADERQPRDADIMVRVVVVGPMALRGVTWHIDTESFKGDLCVSRAYMGERFADTSTVHIEGRVRHPIRIPLLGRPMGRVILEMTATVSADTMINLPEVR